LRTPTSGEPVIWGSTSAYNVVNLDNCGWCTSARPQATNYRGACRSESFSRSRIHPGMPVIHL
jgi:hypothetical protein